MAKTGVTGTKRILNAAVYSWQGLKATYRHEAAFRQELWLTVVLAPAGIYLGDSLLEKALLVCSLLFVLLIELLNSAIEAIVDRIGDEFHELSGRAKDIGSATVLIAIIMAVILWAAILAS